MKKNLKKALVFTLVSILWVSTLMGCSDTSGTSSTTKSEADTSGTAVSASTGENSVDPAAMEKVSIMMPLWSPEAPQQDSPVWTALEEMSGLSLDLQFIPSDSYNDKLNVSIAAATQLPHAFCVLQNKDNTFVSAARSGMFWDLGDVLKNSQNISKNLTEEVLYSGAIDGVNYYLPRTRITTRVAVNYRKDWLEELNLEIPETLDDLYEIIKAFATQDPDGNGKDDTFGMITAQSDDTGLWGFGIAAVINGSGNGWVEQDGELIPTFMTEPYIDTIKWYKKLYDEKLINQDFATIKQEKGFELINAEQGGVFLGNSDESTNRFDALLSAKQAEDPEYELTDLFDFQSRMMSPDGSIRILGGAQFYGGFAFPKTMLETPEELQTVFNLFDLIDSEEGKALTKWGIEGINHEIKDGKAFQINESRITTDVVAFQQLGITAVSIPAKLTGEEIPLKMKTDADQLANQQYAISDPTVPFISETYTAKGLEIRKLYTDATIQWIMGEIDESGYMAAVEQWKESGGQDIINEMNEAWKNS